MSTVTIPLNNQFIALNDVVLITEGVEYLFQNTGAYTITFVITDSLPSVGTQGLQLQSLDRFRLTANSQIIYVTVGSSTGGLGQLTIYDTDLVASLELRDNANNQIFTNAHTPILINAV